MWLLQLDTSHVIQHPPPLILCTTLLIEMATNWVGIGSNNDEGGDRLSCPSQIWYVLFRFMCVFRTNKTHSAHPCDNDNNPSSCHVNHPTHSRFEWRRVNLGYHHPSLARNVRQRGFPSTSTPLTCVLSDGGYHLSTTPPPHVSSDRGGNPGHHHPSLTQNTTAGLFPRLLTTSWPPLDHPSHSRFEWWRGKPAHHPSLTRNVRRTGFTPTTTLSTHHKPLPRSKRETEGFSHPSQLQTPPSLESKAEGFHTHHHQPSLTRNARFFLI